MYAVFKEYAFVLNIINCKIDAKYRKNSENPFQIENKYPIMKDILLSEYIDNSCKFYNQNIGELSWKV